MHVNKSHTLSRFVLLTVFMYLVWEHGFVRSDGHMFIFFANALLTVIAFPALLDDLPHRHWPAQVLLGLASLLCVWGLHSTGMQVGWPDVHVASTLPIAGQALAPLYICSDSGLLYVRVMSID